MEEGIELFLSDWINLKFRNRYRSAGVADHQTQRIPLRERESESARE